MKQLISSVSQWKSIAEMVNIPAVQIRIMEPAFKVVI